MAFWKRSAIKAAIAYSLKSEHSLALDQESFCHSSKIRRKSGLWKCFSSLFRSQSQTEDVNEMLWPGYERFEFGGVLCYSILLCSMHLMKKQTKKLLHIWLIYYAFPSSAAVVRSIILFSNDMTSFDESLEILISENHCIKNLTITTSLILLILVTTHSVKEIQNNKKNKG